jgi:ATP:corrinoid adenosyltransferase
MAIYYRTIVKTFFNNVTENIKWSVLRLFVSYRDISEKYRGVKRMGYIYLYTGIGRSKTANALGLALRSVGHGHKVVIIQFLKWWKNTGEYKILHKLEAFYEIYLFNREGWIGLDNLNEEDRKLARRVGLPPRRLSKGRSLLFCFWTR